MVEAYGVGPLGTTYRARDRDGRAVAVKVVPHGLLPTTDSRDAFVASAGFLVGLLAMVAVAAWPVLVRDVGGARSLTVATARNADASLAAGLRWWFFAAALVAGYFVNLFRLHAGKKA